MSDARILTVAEMRAADRYTIEKGTPSAVLMRRAAQGIFEAFSAWKDHRILIVCGSGNNAGDGYALAEILKNNGMEPEVLCLYDRFSEDGEYYYKRCLEAGVTILKDFPNTVNFSEYDIIVDCMLGTGFSGTPREPIAGAIQAINKARESGAFVICADINSGMNGDTGEGEIAVKSDLTVSIGYLKPGFFRESAKDLIGKLVNADIGIEIPEKP